MAKITDRKNKLLKQIVYNILLWAGQPELTYMGKCVCSVLKIGCKMGRLKTLLYVLSNKWLFCFCIYV